MNTEASEVLKIYLGAGESGGYRPYAHEQRMHDAYDDQAETMLSAIRKYLDEHHPMSEWTHKNLASEQAAFEAILLRNFPSSVRWQLMRLLVGGLTAGAECANAAQPFVPADGPDGPPLNSNVMSKV